MLSELYEEEERFRNEEEEEKDYDEVQYYSGTAAETLSPKPNFEIRGTIHPLQTPRVFINNRIAKPKQPLVRQSLPLPQQIDSDHLLMQVKPFGIDYHKLKKSLGEPNNRSR